MADNDEQIGIRCEDCAYCEQYLVEPKIVGCFCNEISVEIGPHEVCGACSYFEPKDEVK